ncbi:hypothetical protein QVD17_26267 [Tagetes erecta]|uniref:Uncharacterized protein n=1 Tax=Tagetes erecta TaxID=13708 RepID=A0AAD8KCI9_TARER|nr:hypothetical protein QVD17_42346 [Tagetes erecta]KAK1417145.1 hypothetical protein QVD17_26267 [Tagetes erecta]
MLKLFFSYLGLTPRKTKDGRARTDILGKALMNYAIPDTYARSRQAPKKEGGTSKRKNQSRAGSKSLDSKQARRNPSKALRQGLSRMSLRCALRQPLMSTSNAHEPELSPGNPFPSKEDGRVGKTLLDKLNRVWRARVGHQPQHRLRACRDASLQNPAVTQ